MACKLLVNLSFMIAKMLNPNIYVDFRFSCCFKHFQIASWLQIYLSS